MKVSILKFKIKYYCKIVLPPGFHKQRSVGDAKTHMPRPFSGNTPSGIQIGKDSYHLTKKTIKYMDLKNTPYNSFKKGM